MSFVDLVLPGQYWDSVIYAGRLYLFYRDGTFRIVDWDQLVDNLRFRAGLDGVLKYLLAQSDYLYAALAPGQHQRSLVEELGVRLGHLQGTRVELSQSQLNGATLAVADDRFPFPHAASAMYRSSLYTGSKEGITISPNIAVEDPRAITVERIWDGPVVDLAPKYGSLAVAAGSEGLWEIPILFDSRAAPTIDDRFAREWSDQLNSTCAWVSLGLFGSSDAGSRYFRFHARDQDGYQDLRRRDFSFDAGVDEIFGNSEPHGDEAHLVDSSAITWGDTDRFCQQYGDTIDVVKFSPQAVYNVSRYQKQRPIHLIQPVDPIACEVAYFGIVVEHDNGMSVVLSDNSQLHWDYDPVKWRVFNESKHYVNHLHIITKDELHVIAFARDFVQDQARKVAGLRYRTRRRIEVRWSTLLTER